MKDPLATKSFFIRSLLISLISIAFVLNLQSQTFTELVIPKYMGSKTAASTNNARTPVAFCFSISGLTPSTSYDLKAGLALITDAATSYGAGNVWNGTAFSGSNITNAFTTDASGNCNAI